MNEEMKEWKNEVSSVVLLHKQWLRPLAWMKEWKNEVFGVVLLHRQWLRPFAWMKKWRNEKMKYLGWCFYTNND
jgi:hypothetical protein